MEKYRGIFPALLTPFDANDRVAEQSLADLIDYNLKKGVGGFYVGGSTAEAFLLDQEERKIVMDVAAQSAEGKCTLIAHIGTIATRQAVALAEHAAKLGYDAISSVAPFYYKFSFEEIRRYYMTLAEASGLPVFIYNFPANSGVNLTVDNISTFLFDPRFIGVKHTSQDYFALRQFKTAFPNKILYNGYDETFLAGLSMGADGAIGSTFNFMAEKFVAIQRFFDEGKIHEAAALQEKVSAIIVSLCKYGVMQGEKAVLDALGIPMGECRAPFAPLTAEDRKSLLDAVLPML